MTSLIYLLHRRICGILEEIMPRMGVNVTFVDGTNLDAWRTAVTPDTKIVFFETISNPTLEVIDIPPDLFPVLLGPLFGEGLLDLAMLFSFFC